MKLYKLSAVCCLALALGTALQAKISTVNEKVPMDGAKKISLDCQFAAGELNIEPGAIANAVEVDMTYDTRDYDHIVDAVKHGEEMVVSLEVDTRDRNGSVDTDDNTWDMVLSDKYPIDGHFEIGACDAEIDFGGVPFTDLNIEVGAASGRIMFSKPNPERMRELRIEAGASSLDLESVGNANFEMLSFEGGVGSFTLDLTGEYSGESEVDIEVGLGSADIILPKGMAVRIESLDENMFSNVDMHGGDLDEIDDGEYESPGYAKATTRILIHLSVGMGSIDIRWR